MRSSAIWGWVVCAAVGSGPASAYGDEKPAAKEKNDNAAWLPEIAVFREGQHNSHSNLRVPPSAFPDLAVAPFEWDGKENLQAFWKKREEALNKLCPRLRGKTPLKIEATDDALRKLLKARIHQLVLEYIEENRPRAITGPDPRFQGREGDRLLELRDTLNELWGDHPKELAPWLEELVVVAKEQERDARLRVEAGARKPQNLTHATRARLQIELDLWKTKNPDAKPRKAQPAKKDEKVPKPPEGDWLADKKLPPSLFPDLALPALGREDYDTWPMLLDLRLLLRQITFCPRLFGTAALKIEPTDVARKLLKARLHQGTLQYRLTQQRLMHSGPDPSDFSFDANCLLDMQATAAELWAGQPKEFVPWLDELLIAAKETERYMKLRTEAGALLPSRLNYASQVRLKVEAELWKVKNAK